MCAVHKDESMRNMLLEKTSQCLDTTALWHSFPSNFGTSQGGPASNLLLGIM